MKAIFNIFLVLLSGNLYAENCSGWFKKNGQQIKLKYAKMFTVYTYKKNYLINVADQNYLLSHNSASFNLCAPTLRVNIPVKRVVALSTTYIPAIALLHEEKSLVGFSNIKYISSASIDKKQLIEVQYPPNPELVLSTKADLVVAYVATSAKLEGVERLLQLKIPVVLNADFLEKHPLARAEWFKFFGFFYNKEKAANKIFNEIEREFDSIKSNVKKNVSRRPLVLVGKNDNGIWRGPSAQSDFIKLLTLAGADYFFPKKNKVAESIESVLKNLNKIDFWLPQNSWYNLNQLLAHDQRYKNFPFVMAKNVYNSTNKVTRNGGNDYWESAFMRPDLLLKDLVKIFHPHLLPHHELQWFKKLDYAKSK